MFYYSERRGPIILSFIVFIIVLLLTGSSNIFNLEQVTTVVLVPLLFVYIFFKYKSYPSNKSFELVIYILIFGSGIISSFYSVDFLVAISMLKKMFGTILIAYVVLVINKKSDFYNIFFIGQVVSILLLIFYMYRQGNINLQALSDSTGRERFLLNANAYSYFMFYANISIFYLHQRYRNKLTFISIIILPLIFLLITVVLASRGGLVILLFINFSYWFFIEDSGKFFYKRIILSALFVFMLYTGYNNYFKGSHLEERTLWHLQHGDSRSSLLEQSIVLFSDNPYLGVGPGQTMFYTTRKQFSHNSYVEIAATQGFFALILLIILFLYPVYEAIRLYKEPGINRTFLKLNLLFFIVFLINNMFYPFYFYPELMMFFFVIVSFQKDMKSKYLLEK